MAESKTGKPYTWEEVLSFDRLKRSLTGRVLDQIEELYQGSEPVGSEQINKVIRDEWERAKQAVKASPAAREAFRMYLERTICEQVDKLVQKDKEELTALGVVEKSL
jgi:hypothetical protein